MAQTQTSPYGSWKSPLTSELIVQGVVGLTQVVLDGEDAYWIEVRPGEGGRSVIVRRGADGANLDITPVGFNARTRVHEYGGGDFTVADGMIYFSNFADGRLYLQAPDAEPRPLTRAGVDMRHADMVVDRGRKRLICVREDHTVPGREAVNSLVSLELEADAAEDVDRGGRVLVSGSDFYSSPRLSPDGGRLAWLSWNHPNMPWDGCELCVGEFSHDGSLQKIECVAGGGSESIFQPQWSPDGTLYFVSDRSGWWNLYRSGLNKRVEPLCEMQAEFGLPQWIFGMSTYAFASERTIICAYTARGTMRLARFDTATGNLELIETPYTDITFLRAAPGRAIFRAGSPTEMARIVQLDLATGEAEVLRRASDVQIDSGYLSVPEAIEFPTTNGEMAHAFFYPPRNRDYTAPPGERPPLLVKSHGGPTAAASTTLRSEIQYWTSRGIAVLDVNYGGSTGYGRAYRERLRGRWGIVDVDDCVNGARHLIERGAADDHRCAITGGSAGGYTTLCALTFRDLFKAGASHYGVSDCEALAKETHKFESRYLDGLIGPYPEQVDLYRERSPIHFTHRLSCPVIFFQGSEDKIVLPNQAEMMVAALRKKSAGRLHSV